jgi:sugar lactone lactonase YvrE
MTTVRRLALLLLATSCPLVSAQTYTFTTLAAVGTSSDDGTGSGARRSPHCVAVDGSGNVFVADYDDYEGNGVIRKVTPSGVVTTLGEGFISLNYPGRAVVAFAAVDGSGNLFFADTDAHMIFKLGADGVGTALAGQTRLTEDSSGQCCFWLPRGSDDGTGAGARFSGPSGVAVDSSGNVFVADSGNSTIRKITANGVVTTLAGLAGSPGIADGTGRAARFTSPRGVAVDGSGNVFVADTGNNAVRKITAVGVVTTLAGEFSSPWGVAVDGRGNVFVADTGNHTIRKITADRIVTTVAGSAGIEGSNDGTGNAVRFAYPVGVSVDGSGNVFVADSGNGTIRMGVPAVSPFFALTPPQSQHINVGAVAAFAVVADGSGFSYQWKKDGVAIAGVTGSTYQIASTVVGDMGFYSVVVTGAAGTVESSVATLTVATGGTSRLGNFSARGLMPAGSQLTAGFVVRGSGTKTVLVRGVGPTLGGFGVPGALADPQLEIFRDDSGTASNSNNDWSNGAALASTFASVGAFPFPVGSKDAAVLATLGTAGYTACVTSRVAGGGGIALIEVYDRDNADAASRLGNISTLGFVGVDGEALTLGFVIDGAAPKNLLIRGVGPGLAPFGESGVNDPRISVGRVGQNAAVASNDNWDGDATLAREFASAGTFALPVSSKDAALLIRLPPGGYTVTVSGLPYSVGRRALLEIYDLDPEVR